jgi:hypothetical protein
MKNMSREFPWRSHSDEELNAEFLRLRIKAKEPIIFPLSFSIIGFKCTNQLFQFERMRTPGVGRPSTLDYWNKKQEDVIRFSNKMGHDNFRTLNYFNHAPSHFPIVSAAKIYRHFNATKVFDPYAGWGIVVLPRWPSISIILESMRIRLSKNHFEILSIDTTHQPLMLKSSSSVAKNLTWG